MEEMKKQMETMQQELNKYKTKQDLTRQSWSKNSKTYYKKKFIDNKENPEIQLKLEKRRQYQREYYAKNKDMILTQAKDKRKNRPNRTE